MKKIFVFIVSFILFLLFSVTCFADNYSVYGSVNADNQYVSILTSFLPNESNYKIGDKFVVARIGEFNYRLFYGNLPDTYYYIDYSRYIISSQYYDWKVTRGSGVNLNLSLNDHTIVGNTENTIYKNIESLFSDKFVIWLLPIVVIVLLFFVFKPSKGVRL